MSPGSENFRKSKQDLIKDIERLHRQIGKLKLAASGRVSDVFSEDRIEESYRTVVEDQTEMIARHLPNGILTFVNRAYCQYHRRAREELVGTNFYLLISPSNRRIVRKNISSLSRDNPLVANLQQVITPEGEYRWHQWFNRAIFDRKGKMIEFQAVGRDITDLKNIEKDLKRKEAALKEQKEALERKNVALHEILEQIEIEKKQIKDDVVDNVETLFLPTLRKIRNQLPRVEPRYLDLLEKNLMNLVSSFGRKISGGDIQLTPREIEICDLIRNGFTSKEIAELLRIAFNTVEAHRTHIRKKLGLANKKLNLTTFLNTIT